MSRFSVGARIETTMGIFQCGTVITSIPLRQYTDGSYREPLGLEKHRAVYVRWDDGTQGWTHRQFVALV